MHLKDRLVSADSNSLVNRQALLAARQMQFSSPPGANGASVKIKIDFTVEGSEYDRLAREERERKEQAAKKRQEEEKARQQQLEEKRQARQEQLLRKRQARQEQEQKQQQQVESAPASPVNIQPAAKPLPNLSEPEMDEERLRKFRERINNY